MSPANKPKLVVLLSRLPYPLDKGDKLRAFEQIKQFNQFFQVHIICLADKKVKTKHTDPIRQICKELHVFYLPKWVSYLQAGIAILGSRPFQVAYFFNPRIRRKMDKLIQNIGPDHIYCQLIRMSEYVKNNHSCPKTLDYMDAFSKGIERRIATAGWLEKWLFVAENKRVSQYEKRIFDYFDLQTIISHQDRSYIHHAQKDQIFEVLNGVRDSFFEPFDTDKKYDAVFVGNLSYPPNIQAIEYIVDELLPEIWKINPNFTFCATGSSPAFQVVQKCRQDERIILNGWVDDIREAYASGKLFLAPMFIGTGLQNKLLEAMAMGVPCLTTNLANNALQAEHLQSVYVGNNKAELLEGIFYLSKEKNQAEIGKKGQAYVEGRFRWNEVSREIIQQMLTTTSNFQQIKR